MKKRYLAYKTTHEAQRSELKLCRKAAWGKKLVALTALTWMWTKGLIKFCSLLEYVHEMRWINNYLVSRIDRGQDDVIVAIWWCHTGALEGLCTCFVVILFSFPRPWPRRLPGSTSCTLRAVSFLTTAYFVVGGSREQGWRFVLGLCGGRQTVKARSFIRGPVNQAFVVGLHDWHCPPDHHGDLIPAVSKGGENIL